MDVVTNTDPNGNNVPPPFPHPKDYLVGPKINILPAHGWTTSSILFNHLDENVNKVMSKPITSLAAVIIGRDRPSDRAMGADAIANAIVKVGLTTEDDFTVIPATPKDGDPDGPVLPHTNLILCNSSQLKDKIIADPSKAVVHTQRKDESDGFSFYLMPAYPEHSWYIGTYVGVSDRVTRVEFITALFKQLASDPDVTTLIHDNHDRVPDAPDTITAIRALLEYAEVKPGQVWMSTRRGFAPQRQNAIHLYMPPPSMQSDAIKAWKEHLTSTSFAFVVDCRGRATPFKPSRAGRSRPMECTECLGLDHYKDECPIATSPGFCAVHLNQAELDSVSVGTSLGTIRDKDTADRDGFKTVTRNFRTVGAGPNRRGFGYRGRRQASTMLSITTEPTATNSDSNDSDDIPDLVPADSSGPRPTTPVIHRRDGLTDSLRRMIITSPILRSITTGSAFSPRVHEAFMTGSHDEGLHQPHRYTGTTFRNDMNWQPSIRISRRAIRDAVADRYTNPDNTNPNGERNHRRGQNAHYGSWAPNNGNAETDTHRGTRRSRGLNPRMILRLTHRLQNPSHTRGLDTRMVLDLVRRLQGLVQTLQNMREDEFVF
ncbi:hypothetical protein B0H12DRAFT_1243685 [Mycena haematopus]|nr:hypothetical protein B0H12DRAFT_1243685 [Mycena haematopus]